MLTKNKTSSSHQQTRNRAEPTLLLRVMQRGRLRGPRCPATAPPELTYLRYGVCVESVFLRGPRAFFPNFSTRERNYSQRCPCPVPSRLPREPPLMQISHAASAQTSVRNPLRSASNTTSADVGSKPRSVLCCDSGKLIIMSVRNDVYLLFGKRY